jgi:hypothetical protein
MTSKLDKMKLIIVAAYHWYSELSIPSWTFISPVENESASKPAQLENATDHHNI